MDLIWNLDNIYTSFDSEKFKMDMKQLKDYINAINELDIDSFGCDENTCFRVEEFLRLNNEYRELYSKLSSYAYLTLNVDFENTEAMNILDEIEDENLELTKVFVRFTRWFRNTENLDKIIMNSTYLLEHRFYLSELLLKSKYLLDEQEEIFFAKMQKTGAKAWEKLYMDITSTTTTDVIIDNVVEKVTLAELRNMAYKSNASLRKRSYYAEEELCKSVSKVCANCINGISGEALTNYEMRGYKSPLEKVLIDSRMDFETLNAMISAIEESLPIFQNFYRKKAEILGHEDKLPFYDIYAPIGCGDIKISYSDVKNSIISSFKTFNEKLASFANKLFEERWIHAEPMIGKANYGLSVDIFPIKESRIITNFNGNYIDISILAHEIGHAYHSSTLYDEQMLNTDYPIPIAETASIFCETIVSNELFKTLPNNEALIILERSISDAAYYIVDFYARFLLEKELFEKRKSGFLSVEELNELTISCMEKAYGNGIDTKTIHPYMWMNKVGYFMVGNEFLNFPYSFGVLFSKGLYAEYIKRGQAFVEEYDELLSCTSKNNIVDIAKMMNIDVHSIEFWRDSLKLIEKDIEKFISIS